MNVVCPSCESLVEFDGRNEISMASCPVCGDSLNRLDENETLSYNMTQETVGHFQLLNKIGAGGFGSVWKARDTKLDRIVAVKIPNRDDLNSKEQQLFLREARAAAKLQHPNIVSVYEIGTRADELFIVSDFVEGSNLKEWLTGFTPKVQQIAELIATIADALHHAHEHGIVHRDLKPANIMMDLENCPHIMDFGLAKQEFVDVTMTIDGQVMGTPSYMSPEQASGKSSDVDRRADIYSLGVILFQMLTGEKPYRGEPRVVMSQIISVDAPSPRSLKTSIPKDLDTICLKCLERDPASRYQSADLIAAEMRRFLSNEPILARPISKVARVWRFCRRWPVASSLAALLFLAISIGFAGITSQWLRANKEWVRAEQNGDDLAKEELRKSQYLYVAHMNMVQRAWDNGLTLRVRELLDRHIPVNGAPDLRTFEWFYFDRICSRALAVPTIEYGEIVVTTASSHELLALAGDDNKVQLWTINPLAQVDNLDAHPSLVREIQYSDDGKLLLTSCQEKCIVWQQGSNGFQPISERPIEQSYIFKFSPDNQTIAFSGGHSISLWNSQTSDKPLQIATEFDIVDFCFSEAGNAIIAAGKDETGNWSICRCDFNSGQETSIQSLESRPVQLVLSEDEQNLLVLCIDEGEIYVGHVFGRTNQNELKPKHRIKGLPSNQVSLFSLGSNQGFFAKSSISLTTWNWDEAEQVQQLIDPVKFDGTSCVSPFQSRIATTGKDSVVHLWDGIALKEAGSVRGHSNVVYGMAFASDGSLVTASRDKSAKIWSPGELANNRRLISSKDYLWSVSISPDGNSMATATADNKVVLWDLQTAEPVELDGHTASVQFVRFSPDGVFLASAGRDNSIKIWDYKKRKLVRELLGHSSAVNSLDFSADGKKIVSGSNDGSVVVWDVHSGDQIASLEVTPTLDIWAVAFSPMENKVVFGGLDYAVSSWDFENQTSSQQIIELDDKITSLSYSADGKLVSATTSDGLITIWDCESNRQFKKLVAHSSDAMFTAFSPDGKTLVSAGSDGRLQFWNIVTGEPTISINVHDKHIHCVAFSKNGKTIATASWDGTSVIISSE